MHFGNMQFCLKSPNSYELLVDMNFQPYIKINMHLHKMISPDDHNLINLERDITYIKHIESEIITKI